MTGNKVLKQKNLGLANEQEVGSGCQMVTQILDDEEDNKDTRPGTVVCGRLTIKITRLTLRYSFEAYHVLTKVLKSLFVLVNQVAPHDIGRTSYVGHCTVT